MAIVEYRMNDGKTLKYTENTDFQVYKCQHLNCQKFYFTKDDLDAHRIVEHGEVPKNLSVLPASGKEKYFNKQGFYRTNAKFQRQALYRMLLVLGIDKKKVENSIVSKLARWINGRRRTKITDA